MKNNMWKKQKQVLLKELIYIAVKEKNPENYYITWETKDKLIHLCSFDMMAEIKDEEYDSEKTLFTIWEKGNHKNEEV